ncbi:MAG: hypothetical protein E7253_03700 [Lachnospiraceae bacterium]|nr:hypothetical protein [Lachnospiraceae bacterium]
MANKVLSIEIGQGLTRVVEMDFKAKNPKIYNCFTFETPKDVIDDGMVAKSEAFTFVFKAECEKRDIKTKEVVFTVTSSRIARKDVKIPFLKDKQVQEFVEANATEYFPVDMTQYHLAYNIMEKMGSGDDKYLRLNLVAVPNVLTAGYFEFAKSLDCILLAVDYAGNSVYQVVSEVFKTGVNILIKVDETTSMITVIKDGKIDMQRSIAHGIEDAIQTVRENPVFGEGLSYAQAIEVLCGKTCIRRFLNTEADYKEKEDTDKKVTEARIQVTESLRPVIGMIGRVLEYYVSHNQNVTVDGITLIGLGADFSGFSKLLTNELNQKVRVFSGGKDVKTASDLAVSISRYAACIGAATNPMNLIPEQKKSFGGALKEKKHYDAVGTGKVVFIVGLVAALLLAGYAGGTYFMVQGDIKKVDQHISQMEAAGVEQVHNEYVTVKQMVDNLNTTYNATLSRNEDLVAFIEELEQKMPSSLLVMNFTATTRGVTMTIEVNSKEDAAKTLMQLRTFESIQVVSSEALTDNLDDGGERIVAFTVDCEYKPVEAKEAN